MLEHTHKTRKFMQLCPSMHICTCTQCVQFLMMYISLIHLCPFSYYRALSFSSQPSISASSLSIFFPSIFTSPQIDVLPSPAFFHTAQYCLLHWGTLSHCSLLFFFSLPPAHAVLVHFAASMDGEVVTVVQEALSQVLSLAHHLKGSCRMAYFNLIALGDFPEVSTCLYL